MSRPFVESVHEFSERVTKLSELEKFLEERSKIPIPSGDAAWVKLLAKELAIGVNRGLWESSMSAYGGYGEIEEIRSGASGDLTRFFETRWQDRTLDHLLHALKGNSFTDSTTGRIQIAPAAFDLLGETEPYNIFISYRRLDSSALALLVLARLKEQDLVPFVDMALEAGGNWHADLEDRIRACDFFIILLGKDTLSSDMTVKEVKWALQYSRTIIPLWHSGFDLKDEDWKEIDQEVKVAIQRTNAIIVQDESASGYNSAIVELLNRFGVTP